MLKKLRLKGAIALPTEFVVILVLAIAIPVIYFAPKQQVESLQNVTDPSFANKEKRIAAETAARTALIQAFGGLFVAATAFIAWRNLLATQEKQVAERFSKAVEQLGNKDNTYVRLGGIYALEQIARDAEEKYYRQVIELLTAYVREQSQCPSEKSIQEDRGEASLPKKDIQAVLTVLSRREHSYGKGREKDFRLDLSRADLRGVQLPEGAKLQGINFDRAKLQQASLPTANLQGAILSCAVLDQAILCKADLRKANLAGTSLESAILLEADLRRTHFPGTKLKQAKLHKAKLQQATFTQADLTQANLDNANLQKARFNDTDLKQVSFIEADLEEARFEGAHLQRADLSKARLQGVKMSHIDLGYASSLKNFVETRFHFAYEFKFLRTNLQGAILRDTDLKEADLRDVDGLTRKQLSEAKSYAEELLPEYLLQNKSLPPEKAKTPDQPAENSRSPERDVEPPYP